jgi:Bap31/Bap29 transmembrane region
MLFLLGLCFLSAVRTLATLQESHLNNSSFATPKYEIMFLSKRWRSERNMWLAGFAFSMWAVLAAFYRELGRRLQLEDRLVDFEMSGYTMTADETTREPSVSREVTSRTDMLSPRSISGSPVKPQRRSAPPTTGGGGGGGEGAGNGSGRPPRPPASTPSPVAPVPEEIELVGTAATGNKMEKKEN